MDKTEFLDQLRASLNGKMEAEEVTDNLRYYEEYINGQLRLGRTETEIMTSLGSPRLIARSIADAMKVKESYDDVADSTERQTGQWGGWRRTSQNASWQEAEQQRGFGGRSNVSWLAKFFTFPKWLRMTIGFAALAAFMFVFCWILKFLFPIIMLAMISLFLVKLFRDWLH